MKKILIALSLFAFTAMISNSFGYDKSPPGNEQAKIIKIEKESFVVIPALAEYPASITNENPAGDENQIFAESTAKKDAPAFAVEDATLFYNISDKRIKARSRDVDYTKIGYSMKYMRV